MSLTTPPKTNWTSDDGATLTDINEIGVNLQALEDSKYESGDSPTFVTETVTTANITTANITTANITDGNISGVTKLTASPVEGSMSISATSGWTPDRGIYMITPTTLTIQIFVNGTWTNTEAGVLFADGSIVRVFNPTGGAITARYLKF